MNDTPETPINPTGTEPNTESSSLLSDIIKEANKGTPVSSPVKEGNGATPLEPSIEKKREPMSFATFLKLLGSIFFVTVIFFGSFLAYIILNPSEALFFINIFSIDPKDIASLLRKLINGSFGTMMLVTSVVWIISLFRALWTPKDLKRKRLLNWLTAWVIGIVLFTILAIWAFLFEKVGATSWDNLDGSITIYDSDLYNNEKYRNDARITRTTNLIGPLNILFDVRTNATLIEKSGYNIESYEIDFDGAKCENGKSIVSGSSPRDEQSLVCTFDSVKPYTLRWVYHAKNRLGTKEDIPINLPAIEIRGLVDIRANTNTRGQKILTLDASNLRKLGTPRWVYESSGKEVTEATITETLSPLAERVGLKLWWDSIDRIFILEDATNRSVDGDIVALQDPLDAHKYSFSLSWVSLNPNEITKIEWLTGNDSIICKSNEETCDYTFSQYGKTSVSVEILTANGKKYTFTKDIEVKEPLKIIRHINVANANGETLNPENTYDKDLRAYVITDKVIPPETLTFDARDVISGPGYILDDVLWKISNGQTTLEKKWTKVDIDFNQSLRYTVECVYTFRKETSTGERVIETAQDTVIVDIERKNLTPRLSVTPTSDYVPSTVTVDASRSEVENGEIKKFIFDFWEGKTPAEGDAIKEYTYTTPGEKTITLTIIDKNGNTASTKQSLVLKDQIKNIDFLPSLTPGIVGNPVDFDASGTNGQIEEYIWNFWDNTPVARGYNTSHTYERVWTYTITLTVRYTDGTEKNTKKEYSVVTSLE